MNENCSDESRRLCNEHEVDELIKEMISLLCDHYNPHANNVYHEDEDILTVDVKCIKSHCLSSTISSISEYTISEKEIQTTQPTTENFVQTNPKTRKRPRNDTKEHTYIPLLKKQKIITENISNKILQKKQIKYKKVYKMRLERLYKKYNLQNISKIDSWIDIYGNNSDEIHKLYDKICNKYGLIPCTKYDGKDEQVIPNDNEKENKVEANIIDTKPSHHVLDLFKMDTNTTNSSQQHLQQESNVFTDNKNEILYTLQSCNYLVKESNIWYEDCECKQDKNVNDESNSDNDIVIPILKAPLEFSEHYYWS
eukprot:335927_1